MSAYRLHVSGYDVERSNVWDALTYNNKMGFSTVDKDNDVWPGRYATDGHCAVTVQGAWWYKDCRKQVNPNGLNHNLAKAPIDTGIVWRNDGNVEGQDQTFSWPKMEMKIKKKSYTPSTTTAVSSEWTVIQRRGQYGYRNDYFSEKLWVEYQDGFGDSEKGWLTQ